MSEQHTIAETEAALTEIHDALARVADDEARISADMNDHQQRLNAADLIERADSLAARRGDATAQARLDHAVGERRHAEAGIRQCGFALRSLAEERKEFEQQAIVAQRHALEAKDRELCERQQAIGRELDEQGIRPDRMREWITVDTERACIRQQLDAPPLVSLRGRVLNALAAKLFDGIPSNVTSFSTRITVDIEQQRRRETFAGATPAAIGDVLAEIEKRA